MPYKTSKYTRGLNEFLRQAQKLSRNGLVGTWRAWDGTPVSDDQIASGNLPAVRLTVEGGRAELSATSGDSATYVQDTRVTVSVETWVRGYSQADAMDLWGELREAIFFGEETVRLARTAALRAAGVLDVIEESPALPAGVAESSGGMVYSRGTLVLWLDTGA